MSFDEMAAEMQRRKKWDGLKSDLTGALVLAGMMGIGAMLIGIFGGMH